MLPPEDLVPPGDVEALAAKIRDVLAEPERLARMARRGWETAQQSQPEVLEERRLAFYRKVREQAERPSDPAKRIANAVGSFR